MKKKPKHSTAKSISKTESESPPGKTPPLPAKDFMKLAGSVEGAVDLSSRKKFQR